MYVCLSTKCSFSVCLSVLHSLWLFFILSDCSVHLSIYSTRCLYKFKNKDSPLSNKIKPNIVDSEASSKIDLEPEQTPKAELGHQLLEDALKKLAQGQNVELDDDAEAVPTDEDLGNYVLLLWNVGMRFT